MAVKSDRLEARVSPEQRARLEWAASLAGTSVSAFVIDAAVERAHELVAAHMSTTVPADHRRAFRGTPMSAGRSVRQRSAS